MTIPFIDVRIFGDGYGFAAPHFDQSFYWLAGDFYTFTHGFGAQLTNVQWTHPKAGERRMICGVEFRPFNSYRKWGRVYCTWSTRLPRGIDAANDWLRQFRAHLASPVFPFEYRPAQAIEARQGGDAKQAPSQDESAVGTMRPEGDA